MILTADKDEVRYDWWLEVLRMVKEELPTPEGVQYYIVRGNPLPYLSFTHTKNLRNNRPPSYFDWEGHKQAMIPVRETLEKVKALLGQWGVTDEDIKISDTGSSVSLIPVTEE